MKQGAKRQVVFTPCCHTFKVTLGELRFRCCGKNYSIKDHLADNDLARSSVAQDEALEVQA